MELNSREKELLKIIRAHKFEIMYFRSNLYIHSKRVSWFVDYFSDLLLIIYPDFNIKKARFLALVHDDPEIFTTDIPAYVKISYTKEQKEKLWKEELVAIEKLAELYSNYFIEYDYKDLLLEVQECKTIESQVTKYFDKFDALGEVLHEILAGNKLFEEGIDYPNNQKDICPNYYIPKLQGMGSDFPLLQKLIDLSNPIFQEIRKVKHNLEEKNKVQHSKSDLQNELKLFYEVWVNIQKRYANEFELSFLLKQTEFDKILK